MYAGKMVHASRAWPAQKPENRTIAVLLRSHKNAGVVLSAFTVRTCRTWGPVAVAPAFAGHPEEAGGV